MQRGLDVEGRLLVDVAQGQDIGVPEQRVVVEAQLGVERQNTPVPGDDERIDLGERGVAIEVRAEEVLDQRHGGLELIAGEAEAERERARLERLEPERRIGPFPDDLLGMCLGHFLDVHPTRARRHDDVLRASAIEGDRQIQLRCNRGGLFHQHAKHLDAFRRRLRRLQHHAEDLARRRLRRRGIIRQHDAPGFTSSPRVHLRLHHHPPAEALRDVARLRRRLRDLTLRHRNAELPQDLLGLILVNLHRRLNAP